MQVNVAYMTVHIVGPVSARKAEHFEGMSIAGYTSLCVLQTQP